MGIVTTTTSPARAASRAVTAFAPVSRARSASDSGPLELATDTSCPSCVSRRVSVPPICPAPMMPIFMKVPLQCGYYDERRNFKVTTFRRAFEPFGRCRASQSFWRSAIMEKRKLGNSGIEVAPLALGGNVFGWTVDEATGFKLLDAFVDAGFNLIDTADVYPKWAPGRQGGESEELIGKWLERRGRRNDVVIATKVGWEFSPDRKGLSKEYILRSAEGSLRRLHTDYIDLYQSHKDDPETPLEETLGAYDQLIREGKVRAIGASNYSTERLRQALEASEKNGLP